MARGGNIDRSALAGRPENGLGATFIALTVLLIAAGIINVILSRQLSSSHEDQISIMRRVGQQRVLSQRTLTYTKAIVKSHSVKDLIESQSNLSAAVLALEAANSKLLAPGLFANKAQGERFLDFYRPTLSAFADFDAGAQALVTELNPAKRVGEANKLSELESAYAESIDRALGQYTNQIRQWEAQEEAITYGVLIATLLGVLGFGCLIFYPSIRRVTQVVEIMRRLQNESDLHQAELQARQDELEQSQSVLEQTNQMLTLQKEALVEASEQLQAMTEASQTSARRFEELFQAMPTACMGFDREGVIYDWNRESAAAFGWQAYEALHKPLWDILGTDANRQALDEAVGSVFQGTACQNLELDFPQRDGELRSHLVSIFPLKDQNNEVVGAISASIDVTENKRRQEMIERSARTFESVIGSLQEALIMVAPDSKVLVANDNACRFFQMSREELAGVFINSLGLITVDSEGRPMERDDWPVMRTLASGQRCVNEILGVRDEVTGAMTWLNVNSAAVFGAEGEGLIGAVVSFSDVTIKRQQEKALLEAYARLESLATTDGLTGLFNHRTFQERLEACLAHGSKEATSLILLDVDHFKQFNDSFGHPAGDQVLRSTANIIKNACPADAFVARYGGEEFAVILPGRGRQSALAVAETIRHAIETHHWPTRPVTASLGLASTEGVTTKPQDIITKSDQALYHSKRAGRNRVTLFEDMPDMLDRRRAA